MHTLVQLLPGHLLDPGRRHSVNNVNSGGLQESDLSETHLFYFCVTHFNMSEISRLPLLDIRFVRFVQMPRRVIVGIYPSFQPVYR
jgi:hypothetical protein